MASAKVSVQVAARGNWIAVAMHVSDLKYPTERAEAQARKQSVSAIAPAI